LFSLVGSDSLHRGADRRDGKGACRSIPLRFDARWNEQWVTPLHFVRNGDIGLFGLSHLLISLLQEIIANFRAEPVKTRNEVLVLLFRRVDRVDLIAQGFKVLRAVADLVQLKKFNDFFLGFFWFGDGEEGLLPS